MGKCGTSDLLSTRSQQVPTRLGSGSLSGKVVVITGASSGIGRATAVEVARRGGTVHLLARREHLVDQVCEEIRAHGGAAFGYVVDVRSERALGEVAAQIYATSGCVDVLINNAGVGAVKGFLDTTNDDWSWTLETNLYSVVFGVRAFLPRMLERGRGTIVNVASLAGLIGNPLAAYTASKCALVGLSESLQIEYGSLGIQFVVVCPGVIDTEIAMAAATAGRSSPTMDSRMRDFMARFGVAPAIVAEDIVAAIERPRFLVVSPRHARVLRTMHRWFPRQMRKAFSRFG